MNRQQFNSRNNIGEFITFKTNSPSGTTFDPVITFLGAKRVHWDLGIGTSYLAGNSISYTYPDNSTKTVKMYVDRLKNVISFSLSNDNIVGQLVLTGTTLGGVIALDNNPLLTGITHSYSNSLINAYSIFGCNVIGTLDLTMFPNFGTSLSTQGNSNLNYILHTATTRNFTSYVVSSCDLLGTHDISMLSNFGGSSSASTGYMTTSNNPNLTNVSFPKTTGYFKNLLNNDGLRAFCMNTSNLDYVDFKPLSGATLISGTTQGAAKIRLDNNNMIAGDVNHILDDFLYNATNNSTGWSNIVLDISGTNANPDSSSGGYDGLTAIATLTGSPYNWTITY